jgi:Holliday junction resolvasome RuvABC endonuclease subunit
VSVTFKKKLGKPSPGTVIGIDPSTKTGIVVLDEKQNFQQGNWRTIVQCGGDKKAGFSRLQAIAKEVGRALDTHDPTAEVFIEGLAYGNRFTLVLMTQIGCVIRLELCKRNRGWWDVPPSLLKKWTTGRGRADKQDMVNATMARWGFHDASDDVVDAYALARLGQFILAGNSLKGVEKQHGNQGL